MRFTSLPILTGSLAVAGLTVTAVPATAQNQGCDPTTYSNDQQRYVGLPCTPKADSTASPCGPATYSNADQHHTGVPCSMAMYVPGWAALSSRGQRSKSCVACVIAPNS
jgi:hypothetical protein